MLYDVQGERVVCPTVVRGTRPARGVHNIVWRRDVSRQRRVRLMGGLPFLATREQSSGGKVRMEPPWRVCLGTGDLDSDQLLLQSRTVVLGSCKHRLMTVSILVVRVVIGQSYYRCPDVETIHSPICPWHGSYGVRGTKAGGEDGLRWG